MIAGVAGLVAVSLRWNMRQDGRDLDNVSVESEISISSTSTTIETETVVEPSDTIKSQHQI